MKDFLIIVSLFAALTGFFYGWHTHNTIVAYEKYMLAMDSPVKINVIDDSVQLLVPRFVNTTSGQHVAGYGKFGEKYDTMMVWNGDKDKRYHIVWDTSRGFIMDSNGNYQTDTAIVKVTKGFFTGAKITTGKVQIGFDTTKKH